MRPLPVKTPVFVDHSGHRHRRIRRLGAVLAVPVVGYVVLLVSSVVGGPRVDTPLIPLPEAGRQHPAPRVTHAPATESPKPSEPEKTESSVRPVAQTSAPETTSKPSERPTPAPSSPTATPSTPTVAPTSATTPTITPGPPTTNPGHGKPTAPPGRTKSPSKP